MSTFLTIFGFILAGSLVLWRERVGVEDSEFTGERERGERERGEREGEKIYIVCRERVGAEDSGFTGERERREREGERASGQRVTRESARERARERETL